MIMKRMDK